jgi:cyanophycin synthetase
MYKILIFINLILVKNFLRVKAKVETLKRKGQVKSDFTEVEYSYYLREVAHFGVIATVLDNNVLQLRKGNTIHNVWKAFTDFDGEASLMIAGDKALCASMLKEAGLPVPNYIVLKSGDYRNTIAFKKRIKAPIVIKPAKNTGDSTGVYIKPESFFDIWFAVNNAGIYGKEIIVEEFVEGTNYRLLFCKEKFLGACSRIPSFVVGDGVQTIRELIERANKDRLEQGNYLRYNPRTRPILYKIAISEFLIRCIKKQGLTLNSIPEKDTRVQLQDICHWLRGGQYIDVTDIISPKLVELGRKAVQVTGIKCAGADLIARDIRNPKEGTYVINEINTSPALLVHYEVQNQDKMRPVAREIMKIMFDIE